MHTYNEKLRNNSILRARKRELRFTSRSMRLISQTQHVCSDLKSTQFSAIKTLGTNLFLACKNPSESNYGTFFNSGYICDISDLVILSIRGER